jgi:RNA polymerase sigma factor (sigma-70 family)
MTSAPMPRALEDIRHLVEAGRAADLSDRQLLERFARQRDEAAFAQLVRRHGAMVLGVCWRVLRHRHDAEDAFQAAFLVLARKASSVRWQDSAGGWLFQVAYHLALKMRADADRHRACPLPDVAGPDPGDDPSGGELRAILDEELSRLPEKYRAALLLCHWEGKTRAEAARLLGWKEGAVKIRLERGRALLRARLRRRGLGLSGLLAGSVLAGNGARASLSAAQVEAAVASARWFALGNVSATGAAPSAAALAEGVLKAMTMTRMKIAALLLLAVGVVSLGVGWWAQRALADKPDEAPPPPAPARADAGLAPAPAPAKPLRVLLFAEAPTREYQFVRAFFVKQADRKQVELSICLQSARGRRVVQDVPPERMLDQFPTRLSADEKKGAEGKYSNLAEYDVLIAFDPDWTKLTDEQRRLLERWVGKEGRGLIFVAGPVHTLELARPANARWLKIIRDLFPVHLQDVRQIAERDTSKPWPLGFPTPEKFLKLEEGGDDPLAGWSEFFFGKKRDDWQTTQDQPLRGFYTAYPVQGVKRGATVIATFRDPKARVAPDGGKPHDLPYLVTMPYGKGRTVYLGSGETWRLRQFRESFCERFWTQLARYAASAGPGPLRKGGARAPEITPRQQKAVDRGLKWLTERQHRDGHWEGADENRPITMTALAGVALLMQGSTIREGEHAGNIRRAVDWLMSRARPNGLIGNNHRSEAGKYLEAHGHALLFLAAVYGEEEEGERRRKLQDVLTRGVQYTAAAQTAGGGWGYLSRGRAREDDNHADLAVTFVQLRALRAARAAGVAVPTEPVMARALTYIQKDLDPSAPGAVAGLLSALGTAAYDIPSARKWLRTAWASAPALDPKGNSLAGEDWKLYSFARAAYFLGDEDYGKLLPGSRPEERITWSAYRGKVFDFLFQLQNADGSWDNDAGEVQATALYLAVLQLDYGVLPTDQR